MKSGLKCIRNLFVCGALLACLASHAKANECEQIINQLQYHHATIQNYVLPVINSLIADYADGAPYPDCNETYEVWVEAIGAYDYFQDQMAYLQWRWAWCNDPEKYLEEYNAALLDLSASMSELYSAIETLGTYYLQHCE